jgi:hypothetical protein
MERGMRISKPSCLSGAGSIAAYAVLAFSVGMFPSVTQAQSTPQSSQAPATRNAMVHKSVARDTTDAEIFASAGEATQALIAALRADDEQALTKILGAESKDVISSGDQVEDNNDRQQFVQKYEQMHRLVTEPDGTTTLYVGAENWPSPIPLIHGSAGWYFDTPAGKQEILYRRVGKNELAVIEVCRELVDAEKEYYGQPHDGDSGKVYAQRFFSDPDKHDGLYWKAASGDPDSPIGPLVASAAAEGYTSGATTEATQTQPFQGYYFRVLTAQGSHAAGGAHSYLADGKMTRGFAFLAYPAEYRSSGVMTFLVDQDGIVYEKDLGPKTAELTKSLKSYDRDATWRKAD